MSPHTPGSIDPSRPAERRRAFHCFFNFLGWWHWSLGMHVDLWHPQLAIHLPFGFLAVGWHRYGAHLRRRPRWYGWDCASDATDRALTRAHKANVKAAERLLRRIQVSKILMNDALVKGNDAKF